MISAVVTSFTLSRWNTALLAEVTENPLTGGPDRHHGVLRCPAAIECIECIECIEFQPSLTAELSAEGFSPLNTRFGITIGEVLVGNVGYGVHVNLASWLEGLNKYYGTNIIVSGDTARRVQEGFHVRIHELRGVAAGARRCPCLKSFAPPVRTTVPPR